MERRGGGRRRTACCWGCARASCPTPAPITSTRSPQALEPLGTAVDPARARTARRPTPTSAWRVATNKPPLGAYRGVGHDDGRLRHGADARSPRRSTRPRPRRDPPPQPHPARRLPVHLGRAASSTTAATFPRRSSRRWTLAGYDRLTRERDEAARARAGSSASASPATRSTPAWAPRPTAGRGMVGRAGSTRRRASRWLPTASVTCYVSFPSQGQGHATTIAQLVADQLGVPLGARAVRPPDTDDRARRAPAPSRAAGAIAQSGAADARGRRRCARKLLALAAALLEASAADLVLARRARERAGRARPRRVGRRARAARLHSPPRGRAARRAWSRASRPTQSLRSAGADLLGRGARGRRSRWTPRPAASRCASYTVVEDCGPVINPMIVEGQIHGAVAQGIGEALRRARSSTTRAASSSTGTLMDYALPAAAALPSSRSAIWRRPRRSRRAATRAWARAARSARRPPSPTRWPTR